jgi:hypothetical protein
MSVSLVFVVCRHVAPCHAVRWATDGEPGTAVGATIAGDDPLLLDLTHVIAEPVCGRTLVAHGADVLHVGSAHLPMLRPLVVDTGFGKRRHWTTAPAGWPLPPC